MARLYDDALEDHAELAVRSTRVAVAGRAGSTVSGLCCHLDTDGDHIQQQMQQQMVQQMVSRPRGWGWSLPASAR
jgi:hypothetical protein